MTLFEGYESFLDKQFDLLSYLGVDVTSFYLDHLAYRAKSVDEYNQLLPWYKELGILRAEKEVGPWVVAILELSKPFIYKNVTIPSVELMTPTEGELTSGLDHVEFVINCSFDELIQKYPDVKWSLSSRSHPIFPKLKITDIPEVKFQEVGVLDAIS